MYLRNFFKLEKSHDSEEGSAITEFVLIAIPLFLPVLLFFISLQNTALEEIRVENLARQTLRAFITADSISLGHQRIAYVLDRYSELEIENHKSNKFTYNISCGGDKCLTPGSRVRIDLYRAFTTEVLGVGNGGAGNNQEKQVRKAIASATGVVDKWRE